ncbi:MAG: class I SAM-dependent methyltransferase [Candidatus Heimdallarchaeota archaeon]|nr:class I SAM-dependent methyltransferase [Candidatus Heimdallarchaeota archaeon]MCK5299161.1 class I SAM-dependent methyltransferase [Candidatus Heimdallarchaeota archaeon]
MDKKKAIATRYDSSAEIYDNRYNEIQAHKYQEILSRVDFSESSGIIDIGCGTGTFLGLIKQSVNGNGKQLLGVDISHEMIKIAHEKFPDIDFIVADSDNLPIKDGTFERIISVTHLQNLPEPHNTVKEMKRISTKDASVVISILRKTWTQEELQELIKKSDLTIDDEWIAEVEDIGAICHKS